MVLPRYATAIMSILVQITTTCDARHVLETMAQRLVQDRLAACVQIGGPLESVYRWQENVEKNQEWYCQIKTSTDCAPQVERAIKEMHSYDEPEIIVTEIVGGSQTYLQWVRDQLKDHTD